MTNIYLTDSEINSLIAEPKKMQHSMSFLMNLRQKLGREQAYLQNRVTFARTHGPGDWSIFLRLSKKNQLDFSCGFQFMPEHSDKSFMLLRYNGKYHQHTNHLAGSKPFYDFHIHYITEKYQRSTFIDEHYACPTNRYTDIHGAIDCLMEDCNIS